MNERKENERDGLDDMANKNALKGASLDIECECRQGKCAVNQ